MNEKERTELIRKGNAAFNEGNIEMAARIFKTTEYKDGLIRLGDYYYFEREQPLMAYGYYRKAGHAKMLDKLSEAFIFALKCWLSEDSPPANTSGKSAARSPKTSASNGGENNQDSGIATGRSSKPGQDFNEPGPENKK